MRHLAAHRIAGDICFFFAVLCLMPRYDAAASLLACFLAAVLLFGYAATLLKPLPLRVLCALPPAYLIFKNGDVLIILVLAVSFLYFFISMVRGRFHVDYFAYRDLSKKMMIAMAALLAILVIGDAEKLSSCLFGLAYLFNTVLTLRVLRAGSIREFSWHGGNLLDILLPLAVVAAAAAVLFLGLKEYGSVFTVLLLPFVGIAQGLAWILQQIPVGELPTQAPVTYLPSRHDYGTETIEAAEHVVKERHPLPWKAVLVILLLAVVMYVMFKLLGLGRIEKSRRVRLEDTEKTSGRKRKRRQINAGGNALKIRKLYCEYLDFIRAKGAAIKPADTSADILKQSGERTDNGSDKALRDIYIRARYDEGGSLSSADVSEAKAMLEKYKNAKKD